MTEPARSRVCRIFTSPLMGIAGSVASLIGVALAVYFYYASIQRPELTCYIHPSRATVVSGGQSTALTVSYAGKQIEKDVTAVQVAIWNAGTSPLRREDVLSGIKIESVSKVQILEARVRKTSRSEIMFALDDSKRQEGAVGIDWKVLERNDGASIQLIYLGPPTEKFTVTGSVIGQTGIKERRYTGSLRSTQEQFEGNAGHHGQAWFNVFMSLGGFVMSVAFLLLGRRSGRRYGWPDVFLFFTFLIMSCLNVWFLLRGADDSPPPFGF
jgi:hypothetical protein